MSATLATSIVIGAALAGGFKSTIGSAVSSVGQLNHAVGGLGSALVAVGAAWGTLRGIGALASMASDLDHQLAATGITAGMTREEVAQLRDDLRDLAVPEKTNQSVQELQRGFNALVSAGLDQAAAKAALPALGRTATAAQADIEDLSKTAFVLMDTLKVQPGALTAELDRLSFAGKAGAFELKDMARAFPTLGAAAKNLGLQGSEAVATLAAGLQMAKKGAADPAQAANNMANFMAKATAPDTVKRFQAHGVNLKRVLKEAMTNGENPMEVLLAKVQQMTKGDPFKIGELFGDIQVMDFLKPMLANMEEYKQLKADIMNKSGGTVDQDFARMMETNKELTKGFANAATKLGEAVGHSLLPPLNMVLTVITPIVEVLADVANASPVTTAAIVALGAGLTILPPAIAAAKMAWMAFDKSVKISPVGLAIGALVLAGTLLIDHWDAVKGFFIRIWDGVKENFSGFIKFLGPIGWAASAIIDNWQAVKEFMEPLFGGIADAWDVAGAKIMALWDKVSAPFNAVKEFLGFGDTPAEDVPQAAAPSQPAAQPGEAMNAAEQRGQAAMARTSPNAAAAAPAASGGDAAVKRIEVILSLPPGMRADVKSSAPGVSVIARTGPAMAGAN